MGFNIGSVLSGLNLPKIDFGAIGKDILTEGKKILGEVVKDSFTLSNQPGEVFANNMNLDVLGKNVNLPNPIGALANKLLGSADSELNKFGVNVDFKKVAQELFHLPTQSGGTVTVPGVKDRVKTQALPSSPQAAVAAGAMGVGGGGAVSSNAVTGSSGSSTGSSGSQNALLGALGNANDAQNNALNEFNNLGDPSSPGYQKNLAKAQMDMQAAEQAMQMLSQIMEMMHQTSSAIIGNIR